MPQNLPPTANPQAPINQAGGAPLGQRLLGWSPVYAPQEQAPITGDTPASPRLPSWAGYAAVVVLAGGLGLGWSLADAQLGGVDVRAVQEQARQAELETRQAYDELARVQAAIDRAKAELGCPVTGGYAR